MSQRRIIVADDERAFSSTLVFLLRCAGYEAMAADNGKLALDLIQRQADSGFGVDLLLTDLLMPEMNGFELIYELDRRHIKPVVIAMSAYGDSGTAAKARQLGCVGFFDKPLAPAEILVQVALALQKSVESLDKPEGVCQV